jgi:hypothetical protein
MSVAESSDREDETTDEESDSESMKWSHALAYPSPSPAKLYVGYLAGLSK